MKKNFQQRRIGELDIVEVPGDPDKGVILLLHGYGADALDLFPLNELYKGPTWIFPQGPLEIAFAPGFSGRAWFPVDIELLNHLTRENRFDEIAKAFPAELDHASALVEDLLIRLNIPRSKVILGGFSQGAILAVETALRSTLHCGGLLIFSGTLINETNWRRLAHLQAPTPFFQSHGSHDSLLPIKKAKDLTDLLIEGGLKGTLHAFPGGHDIPGSILFQVSPFLKHLL